MKDKIQKLFLLLFMVLFIEGTTVQAQEIPIIGDASLEQIREQSKTLPNQTDIITIDGFYDDWKNFPFSKLHYEWDADNIYHKVWLVHDENNIYLHIQMSPMGYSQFNGYNNRMVVNGKETYFSAIQASPCGSNQYWLEVRLQNGYQFVPEAIGIVNRKPGTPDEWEIKLPLSMFQAKEVKEIIWSCSNLGPQEIISENTSLMGLWGVIIIGIFVFFIDIVHRFLQKKKKQKSYRKQ